MNNVDQKKQSPNLFDIIFLTVTNTVGAGLLVQPKLLLSTGSIGILAILFTSYIAYSICTCFIDRLRLFPADGSITLSDLTVWDRKDEKSWPNLVITPLVNIIANVSFFSTSVIFVLLAFNNLSALLPYEGTMSVTVASVVTVILTLVMTGIALYKEDWIANYLIPLSLLCKAGLFCLIVGKGLMINSTALAVPSVFQQYPFNLTGDTDVFTLFRLSLLLFFSFCGMETTICMYGGSTKKHNISQGLLISWLIILSLYLAFNTVFYTTFNTSDIINSSVPASAISADLALPITCCSLIFSLCGYACYIAVSKNAFSTENIAEGKVNLLTIYTIVPLSLLSLFLHITCPNMIDLLCNVGSIPILLLYLTVLLFESIAQYEQQDFAKVASYSMSALFIVCCLFSSVVASVEGLVLCLALAIWNYSSIELAKL